MSLSFGLRLPGMGVSQAISNIRGQMRSALPFVLFLGGAGKQGAGHSILFQIKLMAYFTVTIACPGGSFKSSE